MPTVFTFNGTQDEFLAKLGELAPKFDRPKPESVVKGFVAKNKEIAEAIKAVEIKWQAKAEVVKEDAEMLEMVTTRLAAEVAQLQETIRPVPTTEEVKALYDAKEETWQKDWATAKFTELGLIAPTVKNGARTSKIKDGKIYSNDNLVLGWTQAQGRTVLFSWGLADNHQDRNYGGALIGYVKDGKFVEIARTNNYTSASNLVMQASTHWGISAAGINGTPLQSGVAAAGHFLTKEDIAKLF